MELRHLRYFVAVAEELHFGRAAARVRIAQPALSRQIRHLEDELGLSVLERNRRRVALTPAGARFLDDARQILAHVDRAVASARRAARGEEGSLRVAYVPAVVFPRLPDIIRTFRRRLPTVDVELADMTPAQQSEALLGGRV